MNTTTNAQGLRDLRQRLLAWYDRNQRQLPWRAAQGATADPYHVWLSEIMLQQTTVAAVEPYFARFVERWPRIEDLAAAPLDEVLVAWAGLGYYARARNLHACARVVSEVHRGRFPETETALRQLPGIGTYTAAAIAAIAFSGATVPVDGNVTRVIARLFAVEAALPGARPVIASLAQALSSPERPGDFAQALMDLGATVCRPRRPLCAACPLKAMCQAKALGRAECYPVKTAKKTRPQLHGTAFWTTDGAGAILLRRRPTAALLGGMMEIPSTDWREQPWSLGEVHDAAPLAAEWRPLPGSVCHSFTHFALELAVVAGTLSGTIAAMGAADIAGGVWCKVDQLDRYPLPTLMQKVARHALAATDRTSPGSRTARQDGSGRRETPTR